MVHLPLRSSSSLSLYRLNLNRGWNILVAFKSLCFALISNFMITFLFHPPHHQPSCMVISLQVDQYSAPAPRFRRHKKPKQQHGRFSIQSKSYYQIFWGRAKFACFLTGCLHTVGLLSSEIPWQALL